MTKFNPPNLSGVKEIVYDTETTGVRWTQDQVAGHVLCWGPKLDETCYYPVRHAGGNLDPQAVEGWIATLFKRPDLRVIGHSLKFDLHLGENHGIRPAGPLECTQVNAAIIDENAYTYNLDDVAKRHNVQPKVGDPLYRKLAETFGGAPDRKTQIGRISKLPGDDPVVVNYAAGDGTTTWLIRQAQQPVLDAQNLRIVWGVECRVIRVLQQMERRGVRVDFERAAWLQTWVANRLRVARKTLPKDFNVRSGPQIEKLFVDKGITKFKRTAPSSTHPDGQASFVEDWLQQHELGRAILTVRRFENLENSFINPLLHEHIVGNLVHTNFNQLKQDDYGVVTGRLSCNSPNMQQAPKHNKEIAPYFRMIFEAPIKGFDWDSNDYSQQEPRIFTDYINNPMLVAGYSADPPEDFHGIVAKLLNVDRDTVGKRMGMGFISGIGAGKMARQVHATQAQAEIWMNTLRTQIPEGKKYLKDAEYWAKQRGWVRTKLYRRRRYPDWRLAYKAGNAIIQGTAADMMKLKMCEVAEYLESEGAASHIMLQTHDELSLAVAPGEDRHIKECQRIMIDFGEGSPIHFRIPMKLDSHRGKDWGRASFPKVKEWPI